MRKPNFRITVAKVGCPIIYNLLQGDKSIIVVCDTELNAIKMSNTLDAYLKGNETKKFKRYGLNFICGNNSLFFGHIGMSKFEERLAMFKYYVRLEGEVMQ